MAPRRSGVPDWVGAFAVTAGLGVGELVRRFEQDGDDYRAILMKSLADRLAEAFAEYLHLNLRRQWWGYAADETLDTRPGRREVPGHPPGARATLPAQTMSPSGRCSRCWTPTRPPARR